MQVGRCGRCARGLSSACDPWRQTGSWDAVALFVSRFFNWILDHASPSVCCGLGECRCPSFPPSAQLRSYKRDVYDPFYSNTLLPRKASMPRAWLLIAGIWGSKTFLGRILCNFLRLLQWFSLYLQLLWGSHLLVTLSSPPTPRYHCHLSPSPVSPKI